MAAFPIWNKNLVDGQHNVFFTNVLNQCRIFAPVAIEQHDPVAGAQSGHIGQVMSFWPVQPNIARRQRKTDIKSFGHFC